MAKRRVRRNEREHGAGSIKDLGDGSVRAWRPPQPHPTDPGKTVRPSKLFHPPDARRRAEAWIRGHQTGPTMTLGLWNELWFTRRAPTLREASRRRYRQYLVMLATIEHRALVSLTADDWQDLINGLLKVYARGTLDRAKAIWSGALSAAVRAGHCPANTLLGTKLGRADEQAARAWRDDEVERLLSAAKGEEHEAFLHLALSTGLRLGELRALERADVDFRRLTVTVSKSLNNNTSAIGPTKSGRSRSVDLPEECAAILSAHLLRQPPETRLALGKPTGPYGAATYRRWLARLCGRAAVRTLPPHSLRHTFASLAIADGVDLPALSAMLGHANITITGKVYSHFITGANRPTARAMSRRLYGASEEPNRRSAHRSAQKRAADQEG